MIKIGMICPLPPEPISQGVYALNIIKHTPVNYIKIGTKKSKADYKINLKSFSLKKEIEKIVKKERIDILHMQYIAPFYGKFTLNLNVLPLFKIKIPIITTLHEAQIPAKGGFFSYLRRSWLQFIEKQIISSSRINIVHTEYMSNFLIKKYKLKNIRVIHLGHYKKPLHKSIGKRLLFFGVISPGKGLEYLIRAMRRLKDYQLQIAGSLPDKICNSYKEYIKRYIKRNKVEKRVKIDTFKWMSEEKKDSFYKKSDIVVLPYIWGPYNSAVAQDSIEYGLPIVITKIGAVWDVVYRNNLGIITKPKNPEKIAKAIRKVSEKYLYYQKNILKFRNKNSWELNGKNHLQVYKEVLK